MVVYIRDDDGLNLGSMGVKMKEVIDFKSIRKLIGEFVIDWM